MGLFGGGNSSSTQYNTSGTLAVDAQNAAAPVLTAASGFTNSTVAPVLNSGTSLQGNVTVSPGGSLSIAATDYGALQSALSLSSNALSSLSGITAGSVSSLAGVAAQQQQDTAPGASSTDSLIRLALIGAVVLAAAMVLKR